MSPWLIDQMAAAHRRDLQRSPAHFSHFVIVRESRPSPARESVLRPWIGTLLIRAGNRLGGVETGTRHLPPAQQAHA